MKPTAFLIAFAILAGPNGAVADSRIARLCGDGHVSEAAAHDDIRANPDGFYVVSLRQQISHGDPRLIETNAEAFHLCTRPAATPEMDPTKAALMLDERVVKYLFVPMLLPPENTSS